MNPKSFNYLPLDQLEENGANPLIDWIWHGFLARGNLTLLTSVWKAGKTTMINGVLQQLGDGGRFLGLNCAHAKASIVSEEATDLWAARVAKNPVGPHARVLNRPFLVRPTVEQWNGLIDQAIEQRVAGELDLFVVDPLASFLPGHSDSDPGTVLDFLQPLQRLAQTGVAVLILHHPRKQRSEEGSSARGSGALLGYVDIVLELRPLGRMKSEERRRRLTSLSRFLDTPRMLAYEWNPENGKFTVVGDLPDEGFQENWDRLREVLARRKSGGTVKEILLEWPDERDQPMPRTLLRWLHSGLDRKLVRRVGQGHKSDPFRYRLPNADDEYWDRGELPPLPDLPR